MNVVYYFALQSAVLRKACFLRSSGIKYGPENGNYLHLGVVMRNRLSRCVTFAPAAAVCFRRFGRFGVFIPEVKSGIRIGSCCFFLLPDMGGSRIGGIYGFPPFPFTGPNCGVLCHSVVYGLLRSTAADARNDDVLIR